MNYKKKLKSTEVLLVGLLQKKFINILKNSKAKNIVYDESRNRLVLEFDKKLVQLYVKKFSKRWGIKRTLKNPSQKVIICTVRDYSVLDPRSNKFLFHLAFSKSLDHGIDLKSFKVELNEIDIEIIDAD